MNPIDESTIQRLESSFNLLAPRGEELVDRFYANLFSKHPAVRPLFPANMAQQKSKLLASLVLVMKNLRDPNKLAGPLAEMGQRHEEYEAKTEHYPAVRDTLVAVMADMAGDAWNDQLTSDWNGAIDFVSSALLAGYSTPQTAGA